MELIDANSYLTAIKNQRKYDNLVKMTNQLDTLYQTVSHEMRTPLNGIQQAVSQLFSLDFSSFERKPHIKQLIKLIYF